MFDKFFSFFNKKMFDNYLGNMLMKNKVKFIATDEFVFVGYRNTIGIYWNVWLLRWQLVSVLHLLHCIVCVKHHRKRLVGESPESTEESGGRVLGGTGKLWLEAGTQI